MAMPRSMLRISWFFLAHGGDAMTTPSPKARSGHRAFTMVETLVTISIIVLLIGLLLPALGSARTAQHQLSCQSNLRQMAIAAQTYATIWDSYPVAIMYRDDNGTAVTSAWDWETTFGSGELIGPGPLWSFTDNPDEVMQCPGYTGPSNVEGDPFTGYNYNTHSIGAEAAYVHFGWDHSVDHAGLRASAARRTDEVAIFGCGGYSAGTNKFMRAPISDRHAPSILYAGGQAYHYNDATNVAYLDGHVSSVSRRYDGENATDDLRELLGSPENGFLSDNDSSYNSRR